MSLSISGLEHYQAQQQFHHASDAASGPVDSTKAAKGSPPAPEDDSVFVSDSVAVLEWVAAQAPDITSAQATEPANLGRLTGHLLQYNLISMQDAGRLMRLSGPDSDQPLLERIRTTSTESTHYQDMQSWQKLSRVVNNVHAAQ